MPVPPAATGRTTCPLLSVIGDVARRTLPLYLSMLTAQVGAVTTTVVLGQSRTEALAAHALVVALLTPVLMVLQGILRGATPFLVDRSADPRALAATVRDGLWTALALGTAAAALVAVTPLWSAVVGAAEPIRAALGAYPLLMAGHALATALTTAVKTVLVALGHNRAVLVLSTVTTVATVLLVPALALGLGPLPALGLAGAGAGTLAAGLAGLAAAAMVLGRLSELRGRGRTRLWPGWTGVSEVLRVGAPTGSTLLVKSVSLSVLALLVARTGTTEAAVHQILFTLAGLLFVPALAAAQSTVPVTARAARSGRADARRAVSAGYLVSVPLSLLVLAPVWAAASPLTGLLSADSAVRASVLSLIPPLGAVALLDGAQVMAGMGLLALKRTRPSLWAFLACYGALIAAAVPALALGGLTALWCAYALALAVLLVWQVLLLRGTTVRLHREHP